MRVSRADALQMIKALHDADGQISPLGEANVSLYKILYTALIGLRGMIERQLGDRMTVDLDDSLKPLLVMSIELVRDPPSQAELEERLGKTLETLRARIPRPH